jgi:DNA-binding FadR family transcriptional regulator
MLETYHVGPGTLREALRLLEFQGVIVLKPGPGGGPVVCEPDASALEPMIGRLAAQCRSKDALDQLADLIEIQRANLEHPERFFEANKRFHSVIAWSSGNALRYLTDSLLGIINGIVFASSTRSATGQPSWRPTRGSWRRCTRATRTRLNRSCASTFRPTRSTPSASFLSSSTA